MSAEGEDEARRAARIEAIRRVLVEHWDPLGVDGTPGAGEAYRDDAAEVAELLDDPQITATRIANYLRWVETQSMHLQRRPGIATATAETLLTLREG